MAEDQASEGGEVGGDGSSLRRANEQQARVNRLERFRSSGDSSLMGHVVKVCCVCGCDLTHKMRFKDGSGKYWCSRCNDADHERTRPASCADCGIEMPRDQMIEARGIVLCPVCNEKRQKALSPLQLRTPAARQPAAVPASAPSIPVLPLLFAVAAVVLAIIVILLTLA